MSQPIGVDGGVYAAFSVESVGLFRALLTEAGFPAEDAKRADVIYMMVGVAETFLRQRASKKETA